MTQCLSWLKRSDVQLLLSAVAAVTLGLNGFTAIPAVEFAVEYTVLIHQIPVIPYVFISMFLGIGSLDVRYASRVVRKVITTLLLVWFVALLVLFLLAYGFASARFLAIVPLAPATGAAVADMVLPVTQAAPAGLGGSAFIPAVVFLVTTASFGLLRLPEKELLLRPLRIISQMIEYVFEWLLKLLPVSLFFLLTNAVSVMSVDKLHQASLYIAASLLFCSFFVFWVFPWALQVFVKLPMRRSMLEIMPCLWLSFLAGDCAVALPLILRVLRQLMDPLEDEDSSSLISVLIPIAFAVPMAGSIGNLLFIFFSSMLNNISFSWVHYAVIGTMGPLTMFSEPIISIPAMLSLLAMPSDLVPTYMLVAIMTDPIFDAAEAFSIIFICYVVSYSMYRRLDMSVQTWVRFAVPTLLILAMLAIVFNAIAMQVVLSQ